MFCRSTLVCAGSLVCALQMHSSGVEDFKGSFNDFDKRNRFPVMESHLDVLVTFDMLKEGT